MIKPISPTIESLRSLSESSMFNEEKKKQQEQERKQAEQKVLDSMENQKRTISEKAPWLLKKPEAPVLDEERMKDYRTLGKVGAAGQLVDSLAGLVMSGVKEDYRHVNSGIGNLADIGVREIRSMDEDHRQRLEQYGERVFNIEQANRQALSQAEQQNKAIDTDIARTELGFANNAQIQSLQNEIFNLENSNPEAKPYTDAALRLISQGEEQAGLALLEKAGMNVEDARALLGGESPTKRGKYDHINALLGFDGKEQGVTELQIRMMRDYHALQKQMEENPNRADYSPQGNAMSARAKRLEAMGKELGQLRYVPEEYLEEKAEEVPTGTEAPGNAEPKPAVSQQQGTEWLNSLLSSKTPEEYGLKVLEIGQKADSLGIPQEKVLEEMNRMVNPQDPLFTFDENAQFEKNLKQGKLSEEFDAKIGNPKTPLQIKKAQSTLDEYVKVFADESASDQEQGEAIDQWEYAMKKLIEQGVVKLPEDVDVNDEEALGDYLQGLAEERMAVQQKKNKTINTNLRSGIY